MPVQILSKKERDMTDEEKLKLKFMRTILVITKGINFKSQMDLTIPLTWESKAAQAYELFKKIYKVDDINFLNDADSINDHFPDSETLYPGKDGYEHAISDPRIMPFNEVLREKNIKARILDDMGYSKKDAEAIDRQQKNKAKEEKEKFPVAKKQNVTKQDVPEEPPVAKQETVEDIMADAQNTVNSIPDADDHLDPIDIDEDKFDQQQGSVPEKKEVEKEGKGKGEVNEPSAKPKTTRKRKSAKSKKESKK